MKPMNLWERLGSRLSIFKDAWGFMRTRKKWWLAPIVLILVFASLLIIVTEATTFGPVIYALF